MNGPTSGQQGPNRKERMRLNKALAAARVCSRRKADALIAAGRVTVNSQVVTALGTKVDVEQDRIEVDGRRVRPGPGRNASQAVFLALNKPVRTITSVSDPQGRRTVIDLLPEALRSRLLPVGRLDYMSEGLLVMTDHTELLHRLTHASWQVPKTYRVLLRGRVDAGTVEAFQRGMRLREGDELAPVQIDRLEEQKGKTLLELTLHQGRNRQIRRMCRDRGLQILRLVRIRHGPIELGDLPPGASRRLSWPEIRELLRQAGLVSEAGAK